MKITVTVELDKTDGPRTTERGLRHAGASVSRTVDVATVNTKEWSGAISRALVTLDVTVTDGLFALTGVPESEQR